LEQTAKRSVAEHVSKLGAVCHVVEVQPGSLKGHTFALVHASPMAVARITQELGLKVYNSKRGGDYYAVLLALAGVAVAPAAVEPECPVPAPELVRPRPAPPAPAPVAAKPAPEKGTARLEIRGTEYIVRQTATKRRIDVLRYEVRKDAGDVITEPYVVSFQDAEGRSGGCSCPDWIYRRGQKGDCKHIHAIRAAFVKPRQVTIPLQIAN
jgi:hypothetical protein